MLLLKDPILNCDFQHSRHSKNFRSNYYCRCRHRARCFKHWKSSSKNYLDFSKITDLKSATLGTSKVFKLFWENS